MDNEAILGCIKYPFERNPILLIKTNDKIITSNNVNELAKYKKIITFNFNSIIDSIIQSSVNTLPKIIDIEIAKKQLIGRKKSDFDSKDIPWNLKNSFKNFIKKETLDLIDNIANAKIIFDENTLNEEIITEILYGFEKCWIEIEKLLRRKGEYKRFFQIEVPIYNIFLKTSINGIKVPQDGLNRRILDLKKEYYRSLKILELEYDFDTYSITQNLKYKDIEMYTAIKDSDLFKNDFWKIVKDYREVDRFLYHLYSAHVSGKDMNALLRYSIDDFSNIYPYFDIIGTITSRILISSPGIQYLRKKNRIIFKPNEGFSLIYADFDSFEPGILASISKDEKLIKLYNDSGDIYNELGKLLFNNSDNRKIAKLIFLSYMYGMKKENLLKFIQMHAGVHAVEAGNNFFNEFEMENSNY